MKSPWKLLVQLTSRRRQEESRDNPSASESSLEKIESEPEFNESPVANSSATNSSTVELDGTRTALSPAFVHENPSPVRDEILHSGAEPNAIVPKAGAGKRSANAPRANRPALPDKRRAQLVVPHPVATQLDQSVQPSSPEDTFFAKSESLDDEIKQLRGQLAQKLSLQNAHLRKMLERFDRS
ncbi:hypothetical protein ASC97_13605 [Rhizobium sp. Root1203]|uniref:hypothetical protein n=1 Tax=Rhizobium sp. Root1203 TaxID=1736427 RepID=UPI000710FAC2|nr:hypothetical protein [Rhizobium sp. Root1203]KQV12197.1 hypothetical protein ASC97_13605 [Rhizobium sp. Root1203]